MHTCVGHVNTWLWPSVTWGKWRQSQSDYDTELFVPHEALWSLFRYTLFYHWMVSLTNTSLSIQQMHTLPGTRLDPLLPLELPQTFMALIQEFAGRLLSWEEWHSVQSSGDVIRPFQHSVCCKFRDGLLHKLVVTSGCFPISLKQRYYSPLTSGEALLLGTVAHCRVPLFKAIVCKPYRWLCGRIPVDQQFLKQSHEPVLHQQHCQVQCHLNFSSLFWCSFGASAGVSTTFSCLNALPLLLPYISSSQALFISHLI